MEQKRLFLTKGNHSTISMDVMRYISLA